MTLSHPENLRINVYQTVQHITHYEKRLDGSMKLEKPILRYNEIEIFSNILCVRVCIVGMQNQDG